MSQFSASEIERLNKTQPRPGQYGTEEEYAKAYEDWYRKTYGDAWWDTAGKNVDTSANFGLLPEDSGDITQLALDTARTDRDENNAVIDSTYEDIAAQLAALGESANAADAEGVNGALGALNGAETLRAAKYRGDTNSNLAELMDPQVTAKERYLMEVSRSAEERDRKAMLDGAFRDMQARGVRSGGAEIAALTGAARTTSQNRMMQDLGTQAGAVDRSMRAREGVDVMSRFNAQQKQNYDTWASEYAAKERDAEVDRGVKAGEIQSDHAGRTYDRGSDPLRAKDRGATLKVANNQTGSRATSDAFRLGIGQVEAEAAEKKIKDAEEDDGIFGWGLGPF